MDFEWCWLVSVAVIVLLVGALAMLTRHSRGAYAGAHAKKPTRLLENLPFVRALIKLLSLGRSFISLLVTVVFVVVLSWLLRAFVFQPYEIPSGSMEETIVPGDMVLSEKISYRFREICPGDIVTFQDPEMPGRTLIKRCIAIAGQTVNIDESGVVEVDGKPLSEPYTSSKPSYPLPGGVSFPYTVPEGRIWVMGDNRTNSHDSRAFGDVAVSSVTGRGVFIYWPLTNFGPLQ